MDRRRFLSLVGLGAAGATGAGVAVVRDPAPRPSSPVPQDLVATQKGQQRVVWSVDTKVPLAALTFDDGPDPALTPRILDALDAFGIKATFFSLGHNAAQNPGLLKEVVSAGHEVGSHGWRHLNLAETSPQVTRLEIERGNEMVEEHAEVPVRLFRPPYGRFNEVAVRLLADRRQDMFVWSVTRGRLAWDNPERIAAHVREETGPGDVIDLHDGIGRGTFNLDKAFAKKLLHRRSVEVDALPQILEDAADKGLRLTTVSQLMARARSAEAEA